MRITFISDTHSKHKQVTSSLPGGDLIVHAGDMSSQGYKHEIQEFLKWYNNLEIKIGSQNHQLTPGLTPVILNSSNLSPTVFIL